MAHPTGAPELHDQQRALSPREIAHLAYEHHRASQREPELALAIDLVASTRPRIIVEIGCDAGGTLFCWRQVCDEVYGITLPDNSWPTGGQSYPLVDHGAVVHLGDSHSLAARAWLRRKLRHRSVDVLHIDGDHSYQGLARDFADYSPLVRPGGLVLIHDVLNVRDPRVQVPAFWRDLTASRPGRILAAGERPLGFGVITMEESS